MNMMMQQSNATPSSKGTSGEAESDIASAIDSERTDTISNRVSALTFLFQTAEACQERGGYSIKHALCLKSIFDAFGYPLENAPPSRSSAAREQVSRVEWPLNHKDFVATMDTHGHKIRELLLLLNVSQRAGKLSLQEAWMVYNAFQILMPEEEGVIEQPQHPRASLRSETTKK